MSEDSVVAIWASMSSWFTPTSLFLLLNLMIGTIALSSRFTSPRKNPTNQQEQQQQNNQMFRPSSLLNRVKSINFSLKRSESSEQSTLLQYSEIMNNNDEAMQYMSNSNKAPSILERVKSFRFSFNQNEQSDEPKVIQNQNLDTDTDLSSDNSATRDELASYRSLEDMKVIPKSGEAPKKFKRSMSEKLRFWRTEDEVNIEQRRPATVRERGEESEPAPSRNNGECVDDKADDFINKFRQQLKLQRLDSLIRYKEMITRGSSR